MNRQHCKPRSTVSLSEGSKQSLRAYKTSFTSASAFSHSSSASAALAATPRPHRHSAKLPYNQPKLNSRKHHKTAREHLRLHPIFGQKIAIIQTISTCLIPTSNRSPIPSPKISHPKSTGGTPFQQRWQSIRPALPPTSRSPIFPQIHDISLAYGPTSPLTNISRHFFGPPRDNFATTSL